MWGFGGVLWAEPRAGPAASHHHHQSPPGLPPWPRERELGLARSIPALVGTMCSASLSAPCPFISIVLIVMISCSECVPGLGSGPEGSFDCGVSCRVVGTGRTLCRMAAAVVLEGPRGWALDFALSDILEIRAGALGAWGSGSDRSRSPRVLRGRRFGGPGPLDPARPAASQVHELSTSAAAEVFYRQVRALCGS